MSPLGRHPFPSTPEALALLRIWVFGLVALRIAGEPLTLLTALPRELFIPPGALALLPAGLWETALGPAGLAATKLGLLAALVAAAAGIALRASGLLATLLLVYHEGLVRGFGHINHAEMPIVYAAFLLALEPAADAFAPGASGRRRLPPERYAASFLLVALALTATYFLVGLNRVIHGREVLTGDSLLVWLVRGALADAGDAPGLGRFALERPELVTGMRAGLWVVTAFELLAPLAVHSRRFRPPFVAAMAAFHALAWLTMNLFFWAHLALLVVFFDLDRLAARLQPRSRRGPT